MKLYNIQNIPQFFSMVDKCKGKVELVTSQGDRLNLKSNLCKYVSFSEIFNDNDLKEVELIFSEPEDSNLLINYLMNQYNDRD